MKSKSIVIILLFIALLAIIKVLFLKKENGTAPKTSIPKNIPVTVTGYVVHATELNNHLFSSGTVMANEEVILRPEVQGKLVSLLFKEGSTVTKGTLLAKISDSDLQAQLKKLVLQLKLATEKETRLKGLLAINGVSEEEYNEAANLLQTINADMDFTKAQIAKTEIRAPFDGKIGLRQVSEGSFVNTASVIASMQQTTLLKLDFTVPERYAALVIEGDTVKFTVENLNETFTAKVLAMEPKIDVLTRNITIRAVYDNSKSTIYPGSFARVELLSSKKNKAIMIPTQAVIPELKGKKVYVSKNGKAMPVKVETGTRTDANIEIESGLNEGDTVIVTGIMSLKPEAQIKLVELKK